MMSAPSVQPQSIQYSRQALARAERAVRCAPFRLQLFAAMRLQGVALRAIAGDSGITSGYTQTSLPELAIENHLLWLIQTGVLRREVDGQGLTDSFRLTPLGRQLLDKWQRQAGSGFAPTWGDRLQNEANRWMRLPSWLQ